MNKTMLKIVIAMSLSILGLCGYFVFSNLVSDPRLDGSNLRDKLCLVVSPERWVWVEKQPGTAAFVIEGREDEEFVVTVIIQRSKLMLNGSKRVLEEVDQSATWPNGRLKPFIFIDSLRKQWAGITLHHSGTAQGTVEGIDAYHKEKGWKGIGYHLVIGNGRGIADGRIVETTRWIEGINGAHCKDHNDTIGICLVGDFTKTEPTRAQMQAMLLIVDRLANLYEIGEKGIAGHGDREGAATACPGKLMTRFSEAVAGKELPGLQSLLGRSGGRYNKEKQLELKKRLNELGDIGR